MSDADNIECIVWDKDRIKTIKKTNYEFLDFFVFTFFWNLLLFYPTVYINLWGMPKDFDTQILKQIRPKYILVFVFLKYTKIHKNT